MRTFFLILGLAAICESASATQRPEEYTAPGQANAMAMSCSAAQTYVTSRGAALMVTGRREFDRYVSDESYCYRTHGLVAKVTQTRDNPQCMIGYVCVGHDDLLYQRSLFDR